MFERVYLVPICDVPSLGVSFKIHLKEEILFKSASRLPFVIPAMREYLKENHASAFMAVFMEQPAKEDGGWDFYEPFLKKYKWFGLGSSSGWKIGDVTLRFAKYVSHPFGHFTQLEWDVLKDNLIVARIQHGKYPLALYCEDDGLYQWRVCLNPKPKKGQITLPFKFV